jgi:uncharacterized protein YbjT (DUF2867 family)
VILLTGATGSVGAVLLERLVGERRPVRCLVRDPGRLGARRVRVQLALGDLTDPPTFRNALRGVKVVVHLAGSRRDQRRGSIEELNGIATWRLAEAARRAGVQRFVLLSALGASAHDRTRFLRAKALAEEVVLGSGLEAVVVAPSLTVAPADPLVARLSLLPALPVPWGGRARFAPVAAADVAAAAHAALTAEPGRYAVAGPAVLRRDEVLSRLLRRPLVPVPGAVVRRGLQAAEALARDRAPLTWDQVELLEVTQLPAPGDRGADALGVHPAPPL